MPKGNVIFAHSLRITFGLFLVILGLFLYARQMGWVPLDFPIWSVLAVAFGSFIIAGELSKR